MINPDVLTFANDFLRLFDTSFQKHVKVMFFKYEKNVKYVFSNTVSHCFFSVIMQYWSYYYF